MLDDAHTDYENEEIDLCILGLGSRSRPSTPNSTLSIVVRACLRCVDPVPKSNHAQISGHRQTMTSQGVPIQLYTKRQAAMKGRPVCVMLSWCIENATTETLETGSRV